MYNSFSRERNHDKILRSSRASLASQLHRNVQGRTLFYRKISLRGRRCISDIICPSMKTPPYPVAPLAITYPRIKTPLACYLPRIVPMACHPCVRACRRAYTHLYTCEFNRVQPFLTTSSLLRLNCYY